MDIMSSMANPTPHRAVAVLLSVLVLTLGCGTTQSQRGTEQLLLSDAVDRAIASIDFGPLNGQKVYFDDSYIRHIKGIGFVNAEYIISSVRQQLFAANCNVQDYMDDADYVVEARIGALGNDRHDVTYGMPANNALNTAASFVPNSPRLPALPELSLAKRNDQAGAAKIAIFAYHRKTRRPIWQSGIAVARSTASDTWVLGAGPFKRGTVYDGIQFAGSKIDLPAARSPGSNGRPETVIVPYSNEFYFRQPTLQSGVQQPNSVKQADHQEPAETESPPRKKRIGRTYSKNRFQFKDDDD